VERHYQAWTGCHEPGGSREADEFANADSWSKAIAFPNEAFDHQT
jgi:hypothetical protein